MFRERLTRLGDAILALIAQGADGSAIGKSSRASARTRHQELEDKLAAANSEIEALRARLGEATHRPASFEQIRAEELAIMRQRRLWLARGGDRQS